MRSKVLKSQSAFSSGPLGSSLKKWYYGLSGYNKLGLYSDDLYMETADVQEAIKRLTPEQFHDRQFRVIRAQYLESLRKILPEEDWITYEEDQEKGKYLQKYLQQVAFEKQERDAWDTGRVNLKYKF